MADRVLPEQRSLNMSQVRGQNTRPEKITRSLLHKLGFRFRKNVKTLPGSPDIVLPKYRTAIFVHGCFWHQHENCRKSRRPTSRVDFWNEKLDKNIQRDTKNTQLLTELGWKPIIVWECELKDIETLIGKLVREISK